MGLRHRLPSPARPIRALSAACFLYVAANTTPISFLSLYFRQSGLSESQIGLLTSLAGLISAAAGLAWGRLAEWIGSLRQPLLMALALLPGLMCFYLLPRSFVGFLAVHGGYFLVWPALITLAPALALSVLPRQGRGRLYGRYRLWGSLGFLLASPVAGRIAERWSLRALFPVAAGLYVTSLIPLLLFTDRHTGRPQASQRTPWSQLLRHRRLRGYALAMLLHGVWVPMVFTYLPLHAEDLGASKQIIGLLVAMCPLTAILTMPAIGHLADRVGPFWPLLAMFFLTPLRLVLYSVAPSPAWLFPIQILHVASFATAEVLGLLYISTWVPDRTRSTALALVGACVTLGSSGGAALAGKLAESYGLPLTFRAIASISLLAVAVFAGANRGPPDETAPSPGNAPGVRGPGV